MLKITNKKVIIGLVVVLICIAGGFIWWQNREIKGSSNDYAIRETEQGKIIENKKAGLIVEVPEGWKTEKMEANEGLMAFYSPDINGGLQNGRIVPPLEEGCMIHVSVTYEEMDFSSLRLQAKYNLALLGVKSEELEEVMVKNYRALRTTADTQKIGSAMGIDIPYGDKTYSFLLIFASDDKNNCIQEFNQFLETISIN